MILSFPTDRSDQKQCSFRSDNSWRTSLIRVYTSCHSVCIFWTHYRIWYHYHIVQILRQLPCFFFRCPNVFIFKNSKTTTFLPTWYMHVLVFNADCVDSHLIWYELDTVVAVVKTHDVTQLRDTRWTGYWCCHVKWTGTWIKNSMQVMSFCIYGVEYFSIKW